MIPPRASVVAFAFLLCLPAFAAERAELPAAAFPSATTPQAFITAAFQKKATQPHGSWTTISLLEDGRKLVIESHFSPDANGSPRYRSDNTLYKGADLVRTTRTIENHVGKWHLYPLIGAAVRDTIRSDPLQVFTWDSPLMQVYRYALRSEMVKCPVDEQYGYEVSMTLDAASARKLEGAVQHLPRLPRAFVFLVSPQTGAILGYSLTGQSGEVVSEYYRNVSFGRPDDALFELPRETSYYFAKTADEYKTVRVHLEKRETSARMSLQKKKNKSQKTKTSHKNEE